MRSISIYALTRNQNTDSLSKLERQLSGREYFLKIREWELQSMKALVRQLESHMTKAFSIPTRFQNSGKNLIFSRSKTTRS